MQQGIGIEHPNATYHFRERQKHFMTTNALALQHVPEAHRNLSLQLTGADSVIDECQMSWQKCAHPKKLEESTATEAQQTAGVDGDGSQPLVSSGTKV